jgi:hypothetical protein
MSEPPEFGEPDIEDFGEPSIYEGVQDRRFPAVFHKKHKDASLAALVADPHEENELQAPAQTCGRCGNEIQPGEEVRRRADGTWVHEACPHRA